MGAGYEVDLMDFEKVDLGRISRGTRTIAFAEVGDDGTNVVRPRTPVDANVRTSGHRNGHGRRLSISAASHSYSLNISVDGGGWAVGRYLTDGT